MADNESWLDQFSRVVAPVAMVAIAAYGAWDLVIKPLIPSTPFSAACSTTVTGIFIEKPGSKPGQPGKKVRSSEGLPLVVPAGEKRPIIIEVENPDGQPVIYQWKATYGQFDSRVSTEKQAVYTAPSKLVNDKITIEANLQGCSTTKRTITIAVVPSASTPLTEPLPEPFPTPSSTNPLAPTPTLSPTPTPNPF